MDGNLIIILLVVISMILTLFMAFSQGGEKTADEKKPRQTELKAVISDDNREVVITVMLPH